MKKIRLLLVVMLALTLSVPVFAKSQNQNQKRQGIPYDKLVENGVYRLVAKDSNWDILPNEYGFGMGKFTVESGVLTMRLTVHNLVAGNWYYVELVDVTAGGYNVLDKHYPSEVGDADSYSSFYGQANAEGDVHITFTWSVGTGILLEVNLKNADWVALENPSTYGNEDGDWIFTEQGWGYVLYGATTIPT